ncbi:PDZ domain-containing protein [Aphelenchoides besseyi]|nr:PDZ domain-containing protein [Aphelenchoides besseyi]
METAKSGDSSSPETTKSSSTASNNLQWLDILEKDFDRSFIEVDIVLGDVDADQAELALECRKKMTAISSCFAQLVCKAQTLFHKNARLEDELNDYKNQLANANAARVVSEKQTTDLTLQVHSLQCKLYSRTAPHESDMVKKKIDQAIQDFRDQYMPNEKAQAQLVVANSENQKLRSVINAMQAEVYAARLAAKYLDKELAGRIQQIQLLGRDMRGAEHDRLWNQLEAEIHLHRHKTVIRACRGRLKSGGGGEKMSENGSVKGRGKGVGKTRFVKLLKSPEEGLGISITGGREHGVPVLISDIHPGQPAERCGELNIGDTILSCNGINLRNVKHAEAVRILSKEMIENRELILEVVFVAPDADSDDEESVVLETDDGSTFNLYEQIDGNVEPMNANSSTCSGRSSAASEQSKSKVHEEATVSEPVVQKT